jgi:hypothetical protein
MKMSNDPFAGRRVERDSPLVDGAAVTPDDNADLPNVARVLYVGSAGDLTISTVEGTTLLISNHPVGYCMFGARRVYATGTTATNIVAGW